MRISISDKLYYACDKAVMFLLCVLMADCAVFGAGRTVAIGPIGFRMLLLAVILLASIPLIISNFFVLLKNRLLWILAAFAGWLVLSAVLGLVNGNSRSLLAADLKGFAYFAAVLPVLCVLNTKKRVHLLMKVVMYASAALAAVALVLVFLYNWTPRFFNTLSALDSAHDITMFAAVSSNIPRLFFKSTPYFLCGCAFPIYFQISQPERKFRWHYALITGLSLFAILVSYTRSVYLAVFVAAAFLLVMLWIGVEKNVRKRLLVAVGSAVLVCVALIVLCSVVLGGNFFGYAMERVGVTFFISDGTGDKPPAVVSTDPTETDPTETGPAETGPGETDVYQQLTIASDQFRAQTMAELTSNILASPLWGHGLGKALVVRNGASNEYIYQDIWMKTGIIGLLLFLGAAVLMVVDTVRKIRSAPGAVLLRIPWLTVLLGFITFSYFNPYMNAALGILFYCCSIGVFSAKEITDQ